MKTYANLTRAERQSALETLRARYAEICTLGYKLDLTRGKPCPEQLALSDALWNGVADGDFTLDGVDTRNYGMPGGLPSTKKLFAELMEVQPENVFVGGNASLQLMSDVLMRCLINGLPDSPRPWGREEVVKILCPCPGYDRHFHLALSLGLTLVPIPMLADGPDMDAVREALRDPQVKGIWCVPKYSNPDGTTYSEEVCRKLAALTTAAPDFLILWDNAYCMHPLYEEIDSIPNILELCERAGHPNRVVMFCSTSKLTHAGAGVAALAANRELLSHLTKLYGYSIISFNKVNELLHLRFLKDRSGVEALMQKHADILRPKFEIVLNALDSELGELDIAKWTHPRGGYFIGLYAMPGTASRIYALCRDAGLILTPAGAAYPYGRDPQDSHLRIAPSFASLEEIEKAAELLTLCLKIATLERMQS
ncbi:MAG: aminotransferase class I/II-fold pyridoxal phosphate-dependent enzyme [Clostridiales bacterium]|nr:aminotransferase class I/II-fold pyridoxal phosphate-dependent enzyme [Clostridiales bacterium]